MNRSKYVIDSDPTLLLGVWKSTEGWAKVLSVAKRGTKNSVAYLFKPNSVYEPHAKEAYTSIDNLLANFEKLDDPPKINWVTARQLFGSQTMTLIEVDNG